MNKTREQVEKMVEYAIENNQFYRKHYGSVCIEKVWDSFNVLPTTSKQIMRENKETVLSEPYTGFPKSEDLMIIRGSGSTGEYLKIYWDRKDRVRSLMPSWVFRKKYYNILPTDKLIDFYTTLYIYNRFVDKTEKILVNSSTHSSLSKLINSEDQVALYVNYINTYQPTWMHIQPSILSLLHKYMKSNNINFPNSLRYIESTGEYLNENLRDEIQEQYDIRVANYYGCNEVNYIACECPYNHMHVLEDNVYVEILKDGVRTNKDEVGNIFVTGLNNHAMPAIRYNTGDFGRLIFNHNCPCGNHSPILVFERGRETDYIKLKESIIPPHVILYSIERTNELLNNIIYQYKVEQVYYDTFNMYMVINDRYEGWKEAIRQNFINNIQNPDLKELRWNFIYTDYIYPDEKTGKLSYFVCHVN